MTTDRVDLDDHTAWLVQQLARNGPVSAQAATAPTIEKLRRLEDLARNAGADRQAFQKILSARRVLGDHADLGRAPIFDEDDVAISPTPQALKLSVLVSSPAIQICDLSDRPTEAGA
ncbi:hypothetical protein CIW48_30755 [Methylobacterium sp. P1-11]|uniref:hypothetical protein n=1 Tax=Methylobacterium sp. P1-11 TaxID=2024616 RepID=UPI0011ED4900|nr:hypothetical protein [Methylobacterium sp. P1-11]KAA0111683.1 hypothetical protein CIW48_30755 [Methylobacterium sp. P1-11]